MPSNPPPNRDPIPARAEAPVESVNGYAPELFMPEDAAKYFAKSAGKPYRPSNGTEGDMFQARWCDRCTRDAAFRQAWDMDETPADDGCEILANTMCFATDDPEYPREWQYSTKGQPLCTAFEPAKATGADQ